MTPDAVAILAKRAERQVGNGYCFCHVTAEQVEGLAKSYIDLWRKLWAIRELAQQGLLALADHHLFEDHDPNVKAVLGKIEELSTCA